MARLGIRVDVNTYRGTRLGVPRLLEIFKAHAVTATFVFSVGPDNMGRHLWRMLRPAFFWKMLRSRAPALYGWDIVLKGTLWPGPLIGERLAAVIRAAAEAGHEIGLHAWDHHAWQSRIERYSAEELETILRRGSDKLFEITGRAPRCTAAPAWRVTDAAAAAKDLLPVAFNSDCRGDEIFYPVIDGRLISKPQIPTSLPSYDEVIGRSGVTDAEFNTYLLSRVREDGLNTLAVHAEAEGIAKAPLFEDFCAAARRRGIALCPFGALLPEPSAIPAGELRRGRIPGRDGWVSLGARLPRQVEI